MIYLHRSWAVTWPGDVPTMAGALGSGNPGTADVWPVPHRSLYRARPSSHVPRACTRSAASVALTPPQLIIPPSPSRQKTCPMPGADQSGGEPPPCVGRKWRHGFLPLVKSAPCRHKYYPHANISHLSVQAGCTSRRRALTWRFSCKANYKELTRALETLSASLCDHFPHFLTVPSSRVSSTQTTDPLMWPAHHHHHLLHLHQHHRRQHAGTDPQRQSMWPGLK